MFTSATSILPSGAALGGPDGILVLIDGTATLYDRDVDLVAEHGNALLALDGDLVEVLDVSDLSPRAEHDVDPTPTSTAHSLGMTVVATDDHAIQQYDTQLQATVPHPFEVPIEEVVGGRGIMALGADRMFLTMTIDNGVGSWVDGPTGTTTSRWTVAWDGDSNHYAAIIDGEVNRCTLPVSCVPQGIRADAISVGELDGSPGPDLAVVSSGQVIIYYDFHNDPWEMVLEGEAEWVLVVDTLHGDGELLVARPDGQVDLVIP
jgi:hypothetical protein